MGGSPRATWFVTRKHPPRIGGMETLSWELTTRIGRRRPVRVLALRRGSAWLPVFLIRCALTILGNGRRIEVLHLGDPVLAPLGALTRQLGIPVCVTVHGLDVTYDSAAYRLWLRLFFRRLGAYVCISEDARVAAIGRGAPASRTRVVGIGVAPIADGGNPRQPGLLLFVGRLVPRKGLAWFVQEVLPQVALRRPDVHLAIIGAGRELTAIQRAASTAGVTGRIEWLGPVSDEEKLRWLQRATVCVLPNIHVQGDLEGYGIVALEAAAAGCAVVAADIEGLRDALGRGQGGRLLPSADAAAWIAALSDLLGDPLAATALGARARGWIERERTWDGVCNGYERIFDALASGSPLPEANARR